MCINKKIGVLNKNQFKIYNEFGNEETNLNIEITNPILKQATDLLQLLKMEDKNIYYWR